MVEPLDQSLLEVALRLIVFSLQLPLLNLPLQDLEQVLFDDYP
jgi:hypothetical protein